MIDANSPIFLVQGHDEARRQAVVRCSSSASARTQDTIERLRRTRVRVQLARTHLLYGEWLRRERRRFDARDQLRTALERFTSMGAEAFAARAERELIATGQGVRKRRIETREQLTARRSRSRGSRATAVRTQRAVRGCSSAGTPIASTCARCSASSMSPRATNSRACCPTA
jgi:hypothetical protein